MKSNEIRELTVQELQERIETETNKYRHMMLNHKVSPLDMPSTLTEQRRFLARLKTVLREKSVENVSVND